MSSTTSWLIWEEPEAPNGECGDVPGKGMNKFILDLWAGGDGSVVQARVQILRSHVKRQMWRYTPVIPALGVGAGGWKRETGRSKAHWPL